MIQPLPQTPDGIELRHLRAFVAVAEELNFGRAAQRLYVTQPALSRQIRALERHVGCELLSRNTHGVALTTAGAVLLDRVRQLLADLDDALTDTRSAGGELAARMYRLWAPVGALFAGDSELAQMRAGFEELHAQFPMPPDVTIEPMNAGGVHCLRLTPAETDSDRRTTTVLYVHGGGFALGSAFGYRALSAALSVAAGAQTIVPEYRLAPEHPYPAALQDVLRVYEWLLATGVAPEQLSVVGDSTGAMLVLSALLTLREQGVPLPRSAALLCPAVRFFSSGEDAPANEPNHLRFQSAYLNGHPVDDPIANPTVAEFTGLPPVLVHVAAGDELGLHTDALVLALRAYGVTVRFRIFDQDHHLFHAFWSFLPHAADALRDVGDFLQDRVQAT